MWYDFDTERIRFHAGYQYKMYFSPHVLTCFLCYRGSCSTCVLFLRAIVFVVDSVAFQREVKDVAEFLYQVLVDSTVLKNAPALLIACNKQGIECYPAGGSGDSVLE